MSFGQNVYIPDANFKGYLVGNSNINTNGDSEIQLSEASAFTGSIYCYDLNITDITGIEAFTFLTQLNCAFNSLTSLDVSNNTALTEISCENNPLTSLDVSNNTALDVLICFDSEQLECLNIKNGNNTVMTLYLFDNPNLTCIEVDDENYSTANWIGDNIDSQTSFSTDCGNDCSACTPTSSIDTHTACDSFTWLDGNNYTASNNTATYTTTNTEGCDSTITLDLTIWSAPEPTIIQNGSTLSCTNFAGSYQWLNCGEDYAPIMGETGMVFTATQSGEYAVEISFNECSATSDCFLVDFTGIGELNNTPKQLIKIVDILGRETPFKPNTPLLYIYDDGTVERKMTIK